MPASGANPWLPVWLRVVWTVAFAGVLLVHLWHLRVPSARVRVWHSGHVVMALGMLVMFAPTAGMLVSSRTGEIAFTVAAAAMAAVTVAAFALRRGSELWPLAVVDLAAMIYMFAMPGIRVLSWVLVGWFALQATGWGSGWLAPMCERAREGGTAAPPAPVTAEVSAGGPAETVTQTRTAPRPTVAAATVSAQHDTSVRLTLMVMSLGMAYMFAATALGMPAPGAMPGMAGM
jgi:hypothetical protein